MAFLWVSINIPEITAGIRLFCKPLDSSDFLIRPKPENIKVLGLVEIRESGQSEQNLYFREGLFEWERAEVHSCVGDGKCVR